MKCQICDENEASVHFKQIVNGESRELFVCEDCAAENGFDVHSPMSMTDFLFGMGAPERQEQTGPDRDCPVCRMPLSDFRKSSRLGCPACYEAFAEDLACYLAAIHTGTRHVGKVPEGEKLTAQVVSLQKALESAVVRQDFEEAAKLRDTINELRSSAQATAGVGAKES